MFPFVTRFIFRSTHDAVVEDLKKHHRKEITIIRENASMKISHLERKAEDLQNRLYKEGEVNNNLRKELLAAGNGEGSFYKKGVRDMCRSLVTLLNHTHDPDKNTFPDDVFSNKFDKLDRIGKAMVYKAMYKILGKHYDSSKH